MAARMATSFHAGDWYRDAPRYYDLIFDQGTAQETEFIEACISRHAIARGKRLLEPACGTGRLMQSLRSRGWQTDGYDLSDEMLQMARERLTDKAGAKKWQVVNGRLESFVTPARYTAAYNLVSTFKYLLTEDDASAHLTHTAASLLPGGIYILGLHLSDYDDRRLMRERWHAQEGKTHVTCNIQSWPACRRKRQEVVRSRLIVRRGAKSQKLETTWDFRTYDAAQLKRLLKSVPDLQLVGAYDFCHDIERARTIHDEQLDLVLVLRRAK